MSIDCDHCLQLNRMFLEALVAADRAETDLRCYFLTHQQLAGVSDLAEYNALRTQQQRAVEERHRAYLATVEHRKGHVPAAAQALHP